MGHPAIAQKGLSYAEYLAFEVTQSERHEFLDGQVWAMTGGTPRHAKIKTNLTVALGRQLGDGPCQPYDTDLRLRVPESGLATYPDLSVVCGDLQTHPEDANALVNPTLLAEVLSPSTEGWDRGDKFAHYRSIPELQHYLLVSVETQRVEHFRRQQDGSWRLTTHAAGDAVILDAIGVSLDVDALYRNLPPAPDPAPE